MGNNTEKQQQIYSMKSQVCRNIRAAAKPAEKRSETFFKQKIRILVRFGFFFRHFSSSRLPSHFAIDTYATVNGLN